MSVVNNQYRNQRTNTVITDDTDIELSNLGESEVVGGGTYGRTEYNPNAETTAYTNAARENNNTQEIIATYNPSNFNYTVNQASAVTANAAPKYDVKEADFVSGNAITGEVNPDHTVQGQMTGLLDSNSDYMQRARATGLSTANSRGLLNSSMAAGASQASAIDRALPIASQDASIYQTQSLTNQDAQNKMEQINTQLENATNLANAGFQNEASALYMQAQNSMAQLNAQLGTQVNLANAGWQNEFGIADLKQQFEERNLGLKYGYDVDLATVLHGFDEEKMELAHGYTIDQMKEKFGYDKDLTQMDIDAKLDQIQLAHDLGLISDDNRYAWETTLQDARLLTDEWKVGVDDDYRRDALDQDQGQFITGLISDSERFGAEWYIKTMTDPTLNELSFEERQALAMQGFDIGRGIISSGATIAGIEVAVDDLGLPDVDSPDTGGGTEEPRAVDWSTSPVDTVREQIESGESFDDVWEAVRENVPRDSINELIDAYFNEAEYLAKHPDVAEAVQNGVFTSGKDHYKKLGYDEERTWW